MEEQDDLSPLRRAPRGSPLNPVPGPGDMPPPAPSSALGGARKKEYAPDSWNAYFDKSEDVKIASGVFRVYTAGTEGPLFLMLHGGGHAALTWAMVAGIIKNKVRVVAYDARAHGDTEVEQENDMSTEQQVNDCVALMEAMFGGQEQKIVIVGHSMGGAIAIHAAVSHRLKTVVGLVVIDVVEGTALESLSVMTSLLRNRPKSFPSVSKAIEHHYKAGKIKNIQSARVSVPPLLAESDGKYIWRTDLEGSEPFWRGWFTGCSESFLKAPGAKLLILAGHDRLDKTLTIAQMQGKFQLSIFPAVGHCVHEDDPERTATTLLDFAARNRLIAPAPGAARPMPMAGPMGGPGMMPGGMMGGGMFPMGGGGSGVGGAGPLGGPPRAIYSGKAL
eukprot:TRINITY_DN3162_c0_g1::TRINITY_DN3162_c0_g1_i1::g.3688::m.3688 TRINITY_DN3162_c0_g1::TRINITY_DN3162_c0_g1_i1::g.3688  ORF type:complete len:400 (+),score=35.55,sp/Q9BIB3/PPME1_CAEEL/46.73/9e-92,Abhydrolase_6/PF12697.2/6.8e-31,Abhydrolase_5/PF12695.2/1.7e-12,Abhydrolase_1/PF00561.15/1.2e-11,Lipase_3/PF01764.20/1.3e-05,PGAP1/PF07819.8/0.00012,DUF2305/PF10230.4/0.0003,DLH/PF01738.13/0.0082,DLH/PF01738.13/89,Ser_hydrolase/PF06821.8/0.0018,Esterase/PF00756.15/0.0029,Chlorophyllase2/PF12740.2/0.0018,LC